MYDIFLITHYYDKPPLVQRFADFFSSELCWSIAMQLEMALRTDPFVMTVRHFCVNTLGEL